MSIELCDIVRKDSEKWEVTFPGLRVIGLGHVGEGMMTAETLNQAISARNRIAMNLALSDREIFITHSGDLKMIEEHFNSSNWISKTLEGEWAVSKTEKVAENHTKTHRTETKSFDTAKQIFLENRFENIHSENVDLQIMDENNNAMNICELDNYNPMPRPTDEIIDDSKIRTTHGLDGSIWQRRSERTYINTLINSGWIAECVDIIKEYLKTEGKDKFTNGEIDRLDHLTPREASRICFEIAREYSRYDYDSTRDEVRWNPNAEGLFDPAKFDLQTIPQIVNEYKKGEDNGVCRTFASAGKTFFDALKCIQKSSISPLTNSNAVFVVRDDVVTNHAYLMFYTLFDDGSMDACITDPTWQSKEDKAYSMRNYSVSRSFAFWQSIIENISEEQRGEKIKELFENYIDVLYEQKKKKVADAGTASRCPQKYVDGINPSMDLSEATKNKIGELYKYNIFNLYSEFEPFAKMVPSDVFDYMLSRNVNANQRNFWGLYFKSEDIRRKAAKQLKELPSKKYKNRFEELKTNKRFAELYEGL